MQIPKPPPPPPPPELRQTREESSSEDSSSEEEEEEEGRAERHSWGPGRGLALPEETEALAAFLDALEQMALTGCAGSKAGGAFPPDPVVRPAVEGTALAASAAAAAAAAAEWNAHWDEARGRHYYHHRPSGTVQWKPPELWHARALVPISSISNNPPGLRRPELAPE